MKVILNQTVPKVGKELTVVTVADGYARNFLFPRGLAVVADKNQLKALEIRNARVAAKSADAKAAAEALKSKLNGQTVKIAGQVGKDQGKLFGAITAQNVADAIKSQLGLAVDKRSVGVIEPIKKLGLYTVEIDLHREVDAKVTVNVYDPAAPVAAPAAVEETEADEA